jgi:hypothetical protein
LCIVADTPPLQEKQQVKALGETLSALYGWRNARDQGNADPMLTDELALGLLTAAPRLTTRGLTTSSSTSLAVHLGADRAILKI